MIKNKIELLAPAGDILKAKTAIDFGADAVYLGAKTFSLRAKAGNFNDQELIDIINYAHGKNKKVYIVINIICRNDHVKNFSKFIKKIISYKPDGFICADPFIIHYLNKTKINIPIHVSTQLSITNSLAAKFYARNNCQRIISAREVSFNELTNMIKNTKNIIEIEYFIHGAVCISYSGKCMLSNNYTLRDSNIGGCAQSCRWKYKIYDDKKNYANNFSMSAKDMSYLTNLNKLLKTDLCSMKIEGRMKTEYYLATVVNAYRKAIDEYHKTNKINIKKYLYELEYVKNREISKAWFDGNPTNKQMIYYDQLKTVNQLFAFTITKKNSEIEYEIISRNKFNINQVFETIGPKHETIKIKIKKIFNLNKNQEVSIINVPLTKCIIKLQKKIKLDVNDIGRIVKS